MNIKSKRGDTLSLLAVRFDINATRIQKLNQLNSDKIRIGQTLRIPTINAPTVEATEKPSEKPNEKPEIQRAGLNAAPPGAPDGEASYTVENGDTLLGISRKIKVSIGVIRALNQLEDDYIRVGQILRVSSYEQAVRTIANNRQGSQANIQNPENHEEENFYFVKKGDTLSSISRKFNVSLKQLKDWNEIDNADKLRIGKQLVIYPPTKPASIARNRANEYTVKKGDTLWSIARQFALNVAELKKL